MEAELSDERDEAAGLLAKVLEERRRDADDYEATARFNQVVFWMLKLVTILLGASTAVAAKLWPSAVVVLGAGTSVFTFVDAFYPAGPMKTAYKHAALYLRDLVSDVEVDCALALNRPLARGAAMEVTRGFIERLRQGRNRARALIQKVESTRPEPNAPATPASESPSGKGKSS